MFCVSLVYSTRSWGVMLLRFSMWSVSEVKWLMSVLGREYREADGILRETFGFLVVC